MFHRLLFVLLPCLLLMTIDLQAQSFSKFKLPKLLEEASGVVYASQDSIWWLNDSGDTPTLYL
ncbi:MAG: hypothetical protein AAF738_05125, partial [Bacteroidota bacterium]